MRAHYCLSIHPSSPCVPGSYFPPGGHKRAPFSSASPELRWGRCPAGSPAELLIVKSRFPAVRLDDGADGVWLASGPRRRGARWRGEHRFIALKPGALMCVNSVSGGAQLNSAPDHYLQRGCFYYWQNVCTRPTVISSSLSVLFLKFFFCRWPSLLLLFITHSNF